MTPLSSSPSDSPALSASEHGAVISNALFLFESAIRCGEDWSSACLESRAAAIASLAALCALARRAREAETRPVFPDESYEHPLEVRLRAATHEFSHPRLGIQSTGKHVMPIKTEEAAELLTLLSAAREVSP